MTVRESRVGKEHRMAFAREKLRQTKYGLWHWPIAALAIGAVMWFQMLPAGAQPLPPEDCLALNQPDKSLPLIRMPELVSINGKLRGTIILRDEVRRLNDARNPANVKCDNVFLRFFEGVAAVPPATPPDGSRAQPAAGKYKDPVPGPTLRARVGDIVQLTFLNQVDPLRHFRTRERGTDPQACDTGPRVPGVKTYPESANDTPPNCFRGSNTANIHFHGTHTNPNSTGDNVFLHVLPSPRLNEKPTVTTASVKAPFDKFFADCERHLGNDILSEWPHTWSDLPDAWTRKQRNLLRTHDRSNPKDRLWDENQKQISAKGWPQYYVGAFPFCFRLPEYTAAMWPPPAEHPLKMGQSPGTHWYHAHKHGSTAINVSNGMTGAFIIEGKYDTDLNAFYGKVGDEAWARAQPVLVINQLGQSPNLLSPNQLNNVVVGQHAFSVNGRLQPTLTMRPGEVQLWRIVNTSSRSFAHFVSPANGFEWRQIAQDGVQFTFENYKGSLNKPVLLAPGNRADLLVKAPANPSKYGIMVQDIVTRVGLTTTNPQSVVLMYAEVAGNAPENQKQTQFIGLDADSTFPAFPSFLADIADKEVKYRRTLTFNSKGQGMKQQHTIDGEPFSEDKIGARVLLNMVEEWTLENTTVFTPAPIDHPFHIHINPFQVVEIFDPNDTVNVDGKAVPKYVFYDEPDTRDPAQCYLNPSNPKTWKDCHDEKPRNIWWDVFPIPSGKIATRKDGQQILDSNGQPMVVPGYFKMRSRFVDFPGLYVLHCHILAHEDRGMMTIVEVQKVSPTTSLPLRHH